MGWVETLHFMVVGGVATLHYLVVGVGSNPNDPGADVLGDAGAKELVHESPRDEVARRSLALPEDALGHVSSHTTLQTHL